jgi:leucyl aminopeptidase
MKNPGTKKLTKHVTHRKQNTTRKTYRKKNTTRKTQRHQSRHRHIDVYNNISSTQELKINRVEQLSEDYDTYIVFFCSELKKHLKRVEDLLNIKIPENIKNKVNFVEKEDDIVNFYVENKNIIFVGFKYNESCDQKYAYEVAGTLGKQLNNTEKKYLIIFYEKATLTSQISGIMQGLYKFTKYNDKVDKIPQVDFYFDTFIEKINRHIISDCIKINRIQYEIRDLVNEPVNILDSTTYLAAIQKSLDKFLKSNKIKLTILDEKQLEKEGLNLILAVNKGSTKPAMLLTIEYLNGDKKDKPICMVGKGVMFDTGGLNIKTYEFSDMKTDMTGSAIVMGVIKTLAELDVKKNVIGVLPLVQNDVDGKSTHPGDIVKSYSGKNVEIIDTDAEGRLILADAISYCKKFQPKTIIDIATLTGQVEEIFDSLATGLMGNNDGLINNIITASILENEKSWRLPIWDETIDSTKSVIADLKNIDPDGDGDTIKGASFLINFLPNKRINWVHIDIAGVSYNREDTKLRYAGATGEFFRTLVKYFTKY